MTLYRPLPVDPRCPLWLVGFKADNDQDETDIVPLLRWFTTSAPGGQPRRRSGQARHSLR